MKDIKGEAWNIQQDKNGRPIPILRRRVIQANKYSSYYMEKRKEILDKQEANNA